MQSGRKNESFFFNYFYFLPLCICLCICDGQGFRETFSIQEHGSLVKLVSFDPEFNCLPSRPDGKHQRYLEKNESEKKRNFFGVALYTHS